MLLAALWGGSFLFIRVAAHGDGALPPAMLMFARALVAAVFMIVVAGLPRFDKRRAVHYTVVGVINSALPFVLIAVAAQTLGASVCAILNATSPAFAALIGALVSRTMPSRRVIVGLGIGIAGVVVVAGGAFAALSSSSLAASSIALAVLCSLGAAVSYGVVGVYTKRARVDVTSKEAATGSMIAASAALVIPAFFSLSHVLSSSSSLGAPALSVSTHVWLAVLALGVLSTGVAYLLYFRILDDEGATAALSVTLLVPLFATLWSALFLSEPVSARVIVGGLAVLMGTVIANAPLPILQRFAVSK